jgi:hypothetical protein
VDPFFGSFRFRGGGVLPGHRDRGLRCGVGYFDNWVHEMGGRRDLGRTHLGATYSICGYLGGQGREVGRGIGEGVVVRRWAGLYIGPQ